MSKLPYMDVASELCKNLKAEGVLLVVIGGPGGHGASYCTDAGLTATRRAVSAVLTAALAVGSAEKLRELGLHTLCNSKVEASDA